jgi:hypothetical protein
MKDGKPELFESYKNIISHAVSLNYILPGASAQFIFTGALCLQKMLMP